MRTDKEIIKILAKSIIDRHWEFSKRFKCIRCGEYDRHHKIDCPVLLAEEVLKEDNYNLIQIMKNK